MIKRIGSVCGSTVSGKLEEMFKDMKASAEISKEFKTKFPTEKDKMKWDCQILTSSIWPHNKETYNTKLPQIVENFLAEI
eukprot:UN02813